MKTLVSIFVALSLICFTGCPGGGCGPGGCREVSRVAKLYQNRVILVFYADWCGPCKWMHKNVWPKIEGDIKTNYRDAIFINGDKYRNECRDFKVDAYPTIIMLDVSNENETKEIKRFEGQKDVEFVTAWLK